MRSYNYETYLIERKNPQTGYKEVSYYTGTLKNKPKGWKIKGVK